MSSNDEASLSRTWSHHPADANPARIRQGFQPCCDIDAVENVALVDDDVAEIDPDAEFDTAVGRHIGVSLGHPALDFGGAAHRVDDALKLGQQAVAGGLDDAPAMLGDRGIDELAPMRLQPGERLLLVGSHKPAVAGDIGRQNGRQPPLDPIAGQACRSLSTCAAAHFSGMPYSRDKARMRSANCAV
jgi:hypothetical protein